MKYANDVVITAETSYADIIVPTTDTVRMSFLLDMLLSNKKPVCGIKLYCDINQEIDINGFICKRILLKYYAKSMHYKMCVF